MPPSPRRIVDRGHPLLVTRADEAAWHAVQACVPDAEYHELARAITVRREVPRGKGTIAIASAGTSDLPVAEEAAVTAELMGNDVERLYDVGVAGIHRVLSERDRLAPPASSSSSPAWKARCRASSPAWSTCR